MDSTTEQTAEVETASIEREVRIAASPEIVFGYFIDGARMATWIGRTVELDPRPGGALRIDYDGSDIAAGAFVEIDPPRRIEFTWGWEMAGPPDRGRTAGLPPGRARTQLSPRISGRAPRSCQARR